MSDIFSNPLSESAANASTEKFSKSTKDLLKAQNDLEHKDIDAVSGQEKISSSIYSTINDLYSHLAPGGASKNDTSNETIDSMLSLAHRKTTAENKRSKNKNPKLSKEQETQIEDLKKEVTGANKQHLEQLLSINKMKEQDKLATYNLIMRIIPKMRLVLSTFATSILSPDDFTKNSLSVSIEEASIDTDTKNRVIKRSNDLLDRYDINKKIKNDIISYLINGKLYYLVTSMNVETARMLNESVSSEGIGAAYKLLSESKNSNIFSKAISEAIKEEKNSKLNESANTFKNPYNKNHLLEEMREVFNLDAKIINEDAVQIPSNSNLETEAAKRLEFALNNEIIIGNSKNLMADYAANDLNEAATSEFFGVANSMTKEANTRINTAQPSTGSKGDKVVASDIKANDTAIVKRISPANIVPLELDGKKYGYIHLDIVEIDPDGDVLPIDNTDDVDSMGMLPSSSSALNNGSILQNIVSTGRDVSVNGNNQISSGLNSKRRNYENPTGSPSLNGVENARLMFLTKIFANRLSKETNLKLLKNDENLRNAIYNGLVIKKLCSNQKLRVVYLKPEEVVYINRGHSIFDNVLFFCKLYIATLITILMQNILNGGDKRAVYVEVGEDNNGAHAVQQVIRDIKSKEIASIWSMDLQSVLNIQAQFQDYYIPVVDGEKPISFETIDSLANKTMDDEFLKWLGDNIYSGMFTPTAFIQDVENVDFAKMLSMQNSRYLRECISEQATLSSGLTELLRKIYNIEYTDNVTDVEESKKTNRDDSVSPNTLKVTLPAPAALGLNAMSEQMSNATSMIDSIIGYSDIGSKADVSEAEIEKLNTKVKGRLLRKYVPSASWADIDKEIDLAVQEYIEAKMTNQINSEEDPAAVDSTTDSTVSTDTSTDGDTDVDVDLPDV